MLTTISRIKIKWVVILLLFFSVSAKAKTIDSLGPVFPIAEKDFLLVIQTRLKQLTESGYMTEFRKALINQVQQRFDRPFPVAGITRTTREIDWNYDPSILMEQDILDPRGNIIVRAGEKYNPLQFTILHENLIFYDADDKKQVDWVTKRQTQNSWNQDKLILVNGSINSENKRLNKKIYFDQFGMLVNRFHIQHTPAVVVQDGMVLKVSEVLP